MKKSKAPRKNVAILLLFVFALTLFVSCALANDGQTSGTPPVSTKPRESVEPPLGWERPVIQQAPGADPINFRQEYDYSNVDTSEPYTVLMYLVGNAPADADLIEAEINKILEAEYNTTLDIQYLTWDYADKYPLILTSGEKVDLMYTSTWCYLYAEAAKGSFFNITPEFISSNMPMAAANQHPDSWSTTTIDGKTVAIPCNVIIPDYKFVGIRQDLADKYNITSLNNWDDYMNYAKTIAANETPKTGIWSYQMGNGAVEMWRTYYQQFSALRVGGNDDFIGTYTEGELPKSDEIKLAVETDWFREFCHKQKELADAGCWSQSAAAETVTHAEGFGQLTGASTLWNRTIFQQMRNAERAADGVVAVPYDLTPGTPVFGEEFNNNCMAIATNSENPERAAMVADLMAYDYDINTLINFGIEGVHWTNENGYRSSAIQGSEQTWSPQGVAAAWWCKKSYLLGAPDDPQQEEFLATLTDRVVSNPTVTFSFNPEPVKAFHTAMIEVRDSYFNILTAGLVGDVDQTIDQMLAEMEQAGLSRVKEEFAKQYNTWLESR